MSPQDEAARRRPSSMNAPPGELQRVLLGIALPMLVALPTWWGLQAERTVLRQTKALIEADLTSLAAGATIGHEHSRVRANLLVRGLVFAELDRDRMGPLQWLAALGDLPGDVVLTRAAWTGPEWEIEGVAASEALADALASHLERAGMVANLVEAGDAAEAGWFFHLRGRLAANAEGTEP